MMMIKTLPERCNPQADPKLGIAEKLLQAKDLNGSRDFALLAQETEPLLDGSEQILAVVDVLIAGDKQINNQPDWYAVLHLDGRQNDDELIKSQYRKLALLLHPDKNKFLFADSAFKLVADRILSLGRTDLGVLRFDLRL